MAPRLDSQLGRPTSDLSWRSAGNCVGEPVAIFFPVRGVDASPAKAVCVGCPVIEECLSFALRHESFGIWGGKSERERRGIRRQRGVLKTSLYSTLTQAQCGTPAGYQSHRRRGEVACNGCKTAHSDYVQIVRGPRASA